MSNKIEHKTTESFDKNNIRFFPELIKTNYWKRGTLETEPTGEYNYGQSMTIQGESYTIRELLKKHTSGTMPDIGQEGIFLDDLNHDSLDFNQFKNLDLAEQQQYRDNQKEYIKQLNETIKESEKSLLSQQQQQTEKTPKTDTKSEN